MQVLSIDKAESLSNGFRKFWKTITIAMFHPRELIAIIRKADFTDVVKPLPFYLFMISLFFFISQLIPLTKTYAPHYAPWQYTETNILTGAINLNFILYIIISCASSLLLAKLSAFVFSRRHFQIIYKLFLYVNSVILFLKTLFITSFPIAVYLADKDVRESSIFIHPVMLLLFDLGTYFLICLYLFAFPKDGKVKDNNLYSQLAQLCYERISKNFRSFICAAILLIVFTVSNYVIDQLNIFSFGYLNSFTDTPGVDLTDPKHASKKIIHLSAKKIDSGFIDLQGALMIQLENSNGYIPSECKDGLFFEVDEFKDPRFVLGGTFLKIDFNLTPSKTGTIKLERGTNYEFGLNARMTEEAFNSFLKRFNRKVVKFSFNLYMPEDKIKYRRYERQIVIDTESLESKTI